MRELVGTMQPGGDDFFFTLVVDDREFVGGGMTEANGEPGDQPERIPSGRKSNAPSTRRTIR
jgi:hypothetical protein